MMDEVDRAALLRMWPKWPTSETAANGQHRGKKNGPHGCYPPSDWCTGEIWRAK